MTNTMEALSLQADKGQYDYRPQRKIDATEYKWQFEDIKPLTNSSTPLQFRIDDRPFPFCPREMELHLRVKFKLADTKAPAYHSDNSKFIVGPVNNFGYSCIRQVRCKVNNAETESAYLGMPLRRQKGRGLVRKRKKARRPLQKGGIGPLALAGMALAPMLLQPLLGGLQGR